MGLPFNSVKTKLLAPIVLLASLLMIGCGDATRNDQGVAFSFLGWFEDFEGTVGRTTFLYSLDAENPEETGTFSAEFGIAGLQNSLDKEFIRTERMTHQYEVPGATIAIPNTSVGLPTTLAPFGPGGQDADPENFNGVGTLPDAQYTGENVSYASIPVVTDAIRSFINLNREHFPEPPFVMLITSQATGVSSSGRRFDSNPITIEAIVTAGQGNIIPPAAGSNGSGDGTEELASADFLDEAEG